MTTTTKPAPLDAAARPARVSGPAPLTSQRALSNAAEAAAIPLAMGVAIGAALVIRHYVTSPDDRFVIAIAGAGGVLVACLVVVYLGALLGLGPIEGAK